MLIHLWKKQQKFKMNMHSKFMLNPHNSMQKTSKIKLERKTRQRSVKPGSAPGWRSIKPWNSSSIRSALSCPLPPFPAIGSCSATPATASGKPALKTWPPRWCRCAYSLCKPLLPTIWLHRCIIVDVLWYPFSCHDAYPPAYTCSNCNLFCYYRQQFCAQTIKDKRFQCV